MVGIPSSPTTPENPLCVELFAGCGGLALGVAKAGFRHAQVIERDQNAVATLTNNKQRGVAHVGSWPINGVDARNVDYSTVKGEISLVAGGPPCQPFSIGGKHAGPSDERNMWPEAIRAVRELRPKAFLFENVAGLLRPAFAEYLEYLKLQLRWPSVCSRDGEGWQDQRRRLLLLAAEGLPAEYTVEVRGINAADYGAPQKRHRAIVVGIARTVAPTVMFPPPTHSRAALIWAQRKSGSYWDLHKVPKGARARISEKDKFILQRLLEEDKAPDTTAWRTVRDVIGDLPEPQERNCGIPNHELHPGARVYERHTGSCWDEPAKALKAGAHGVPGGENMLVHVNGKVRYFTIREMARLQGFPDDFVFGDGWKWPIMQLGNAVPVDIGYAFGLEIKRQLALGQLTTQSSL